MDKVVFLIPPLSGEGLYNNENFQRRPFDFVSANIVVSVLLRKYNVELFDFDLDGVFISPRYISALQNAVSLVIYATEGHPKSLIDKYVSAAPCPVLVIGPGSCQYENPDCFILVGEPEFDILNIIEDLIHSNGICSDKKRIIDRFEDVDLLPSSNHSTLAKLLSRDGYPSILISRGCNNSCIFCHSNDFYVPGKKLYRRRSVSKILDEIRQLKKLGILFFHLECESITNKIPDEYIDNLLKEIRTENIKFSTFCNIAPLTNSEFVRSLYTSGCRFIFIGIESYDNNTLKKLKKPHNDAQIEIAIKNLCNTGIQFGIGFLPFNPYTTIDTLTTDMKFLRRLVNEEFSHPLNICCFANVCTMTEEYSFELAISNLYMKFNIIFDTKVRTQIVSWEKHEHIYPERYTSKSISFDSARLMEELILLCKENQAMNNIKINKVKKSDAQFLHSLMNNESIMTVLNEVPTAINVWADAIIEWGQDSDEEDYIIFDELVPIGWLGINGLSSKDKKAYIKVIALIPSYQKRGIGQYVINQIIENLKLRGYVSIGLYTDQSNVQAQRCYLKCGFDITDKIVQKMSNGACVRRYKMEITL